MRELLNGSETMQRGFNECKYCHSFPIVTIEDNHVRAQCANCGAIVEAIGARWYFDVRDSWNEENE